MKIEKVNENQIRCTLTREDLASRQLKISELAYGTEKAKSLFRDMMRQANFEFGFEAEDIPLMIEAIPMSAECIVLIITKVEDPEELDTRFSRFAPSLTEDSDTDDEYEDIEDNEVLDLFHRIQSDSRDTSVAPATEPEDTKKDADRSRLFLLASLRQAIDVCHMIASNYKGRSTLYKGNTDDRYHLLLTQSSDTKDSFDRACNIVSEYGALQRASSGNRMFLAEHSEVLISDNAVQVLGNM